MNGLNENTTPAESAGTPVVPIYALYGEAEEDPALGLAHCESIAVRSARHDWRIDVHRHRTLLQLLFVRGGTGVAEIDGNRVELACGSLLVLPPLSVHGFVFSRDIDGWVVTLPESHLHDFSPDFALRVGAFRHLELAEAGEAGVELEGLFGRVSAEFNRLATGRTAALRALLSLVLVWVTRAVEDMGDAGMSARKLSHVRRYRLMVEESYRAPLPVRDYAAELGITPTQLNRLCRATLGKSPLELLHDRVLLEAKRNLIYTTLGVSDIAYALGFHDPGYFSRFFAKRTGYPPTAFRRAAQSRMRTPASAGTP